MAELVDRGLMFRVDFFTQAYGMSEQEARDYLALIDADQKNKIREPIPLTD